LPSSCNTQLKHFQTATRDNLGLDIGLILQLPWLAPIWTGGARWAIVVSG